MTDVRERKAIYSGYAKRFIQASPAQVCIVFNYDVLIKHLITVKIIFDLHSKCMQPYTHTNWSNRSVTDTSNVVYYIKVTSVHDGIGFLNFWSNSCQKKVNSYIYFSNSSYKLGKSCS